MITIKDIVELAKAGYKPNEVKELIELSKSEDTASDMPEIRCDTPAQEGEAAKSPVSNEDASPSQEQDPEPDYKALYEKSRIELAEAQKANLKKDISSEEDNRSDEDIFIGLVKEFM